MIELIYYADRQSQQLLRSNKLDSPTAVAQRTGRQFHVGSRSISLLLELSDEDNRPTTVLLKKYIFRKPLGRFWFRSAKALREAKNLIALRDRVGVPTPRVLAFGLRGTLSGPQDAFIITEFLPQACNLEQLARSDKPDLSKPHWRQMYEQLCEMVRRMHACGFYHIDLQWRNILVQHSNGQCRLLLSDCPRGGFRKLPVRRLHGVLRDLSSLEKLAMHYLSRTQRLRWLLRYRGRRKLHWSDKLLVRAVIFDRRRKMRSRRGGPRWQIHAQQQFTNQFTPSGSATSAHKQLLILSLEQVLESSPRHTISLHNIGGKRYLLWKRFANILPLSPRRTAWPGWSENWPLKARLRKWPRVLLIVTPNDAPRLQQIRLPSSHATWWVHPDHAEQLWQMGITDIDAALNLRVGELLQKPGLGRRQRLRIVSPQGRVYFMKRYPPAPSWQRLLHGLFGRPSALACRDLRAVRQLQRAKVKTLELVGLGRRKTALLDGPSVSICAHVPNGVSLEKLAADVLAGRRELPDRLVKKLTVAVAQTVRRMHEASLCHRDLYLSHIFVDEQSLARHRPEIYIIDLQRLFRPVWPRRRWFVKDIAALNYSCPRQLVSKAQRMRFARIYFAGKLSPPRKAFLRSVQRKTRRIAAHDRKHRP